MTHGHVVWARVAIGTALGSGLLFLAVSLAYDWRRGGRR